MNLSHDPDILLQSAKFFFTLPGKTTVPEIVLMRIPVNEPIELSELQPSDKPATVEHLKAREIYDRTLRIPFPYTEADADRWLEHISRVAREQGRALAWAIRDRDSGLIGCIGLDDLVLGVSHRAEIGYWLAKPYWGRGIMTSVVQKVCDLAQTELGLVRITACVFKGNTPSIRVLEKCGFQQEGYLRKHFFKDGQFLDATLHALVT